jgi:hypothetical protein
MTAPGWYNDGSGGMRWWDGQRWTHATAAAQQPVQRQPYMMVTKSPKHTSHGLHLFLTVITFGMWGLLVWLPITIIHKMGHEKSVTRVRY